MDLTGMLAVTFIFGGGTVFLLAISPIGKAIAHRIRGGGVPPDHLRHLEEQHEALVEEVESLRAEVTEALERLDFTERLMSQTTPGRLPGRNDVQE